MINWDILQNTFLFNSNFLKISTGITQRVSQLIHPENTWSKYLLRLKLLKIGTKQPKKIQFHSEVHFKRSKYVRLVKTMDNAQLIFMNQLCSEAAVQRYS